MDPAQLTVNGRSAAGAGQEQAIASYRGALAAVELLILAAWRDLVVPDVREQHYQSDRLRKAKSRGGGARAARRGNLEVVRYLPRRLVYRRAAGAAAAAEGRPAPRQLYPVSAFARRLPPGRQPSADAQGFAAEIGIPLAPHQTVVRPHWRGGSPEERAQALARDGPLQVRHWRSWSALDLLRTRDVDSPGGTPATLR